MHLQYLYQGLTLPCKQKERIPWWLWKGFGTSIFHHLILSVFGNPLLKDRFAYSVLQQRQILLLTFLLTYMENHVTTFKMPCRLSVQVLLPLAWWNPVVQQHREMISYVLLLLFFFKSVTNVCSTFHGLSCLKFKTINRSSLSVWAVKKKNPNPTNQTNKQNQNQIKKKKIPKSTSWRAKKNEESLDVFFSYPGFRFLSISCYQPKQHLFPLKKPLVVLSLHFSRLVQKSEF